MATLYLFTPEQRRLVQLFLRALEGEHLEMPALAIALANYCQQIGVEVFEDINSNVRDDLRVLLRIFGYSIFENRLLKLEQ